MQIRNTLNHVRSSGLLLMEKLDYSATPISQLWQLMFMSVVKAGLFFLSVRDQHQATTVNLSVILSLSRYGDELSHQPTRVREARYECIKIDSTSATFSGCPFSGLQSV